jgi:cell division protein FtsI/penicillin-binding protein 2
LLVGGVLLATGAALATLLRGSPPAEEPQPAAAAAPPPAVADDLPQAPLAEPEAPPAAAPPPVARGPVDIDRVRLMLDPTQAVVQDGRLVQPLPDGSQAVLSLQPEAQEKLLALFDKYDVPVGAAVAIEVSSGRVVAFVSRSRAPMERPAALDASFPAASVFKLVTTSALLEEARLDGAARVCYRAASGTRKLSAKDIEEAFVEGADGVACGTLAEGVGKSLNPVLARLAYEHLTPRTLLRFAERFAFGRAVPFDLPIDVSPLEIPQDKLEFARTAAGFWHVGLSPMHGAVLAQVIANGGRMLRPTMIDEVRTADGERLWQAESQGLRRVIAQATAEALAAMMVQTVDSGTGKRDFTDPQGRPFLSYPVAGKTGSLSNPNPFMAYSWFVGFAPAGTPPPDTPVYAVAALVVNEDRWRIKAPLVARETLRLLLGD